VQFRILGPLEVEADGRPLRPGRRRERCLLAVLLLETGHVLPIRRLVELLWDGEPPTHARRALHVHFRTLLTRARAIADPGPRAELLHTALHLWRRGPIDLPCDRVGIRASVRCSSLESTWRVPE
jgi:DNA-binding SARP family transcriptional activator